MNKYLYLIINYIILYVIAYNDEIIFNLKGN
jgi:hypothetical protein